MLIGIPSALPSDPTFWYQPNQYMMPWITEGTATELPCVAYSALSFSYSWTKGGAPISQDSRVYQVGGNLVFRRTVRNDTGEYKCYAKSARATSSISIGMVISQRLSATMEPFAEKGEVGRSFRFFCKPTGFPIDQVHWMKDGAPLPLPSDSNPNPNPNARYRFSPDKLTFEILRLERDDRGIYQCFISNKADNAQANALLVITGVLVNHSLC